MAARPPARAARCQSSGTCAATHAPTASTISPSEESRSSSSLGISLPSALPRADLPDRLPHRFPLLGEGAGALLLVGVAPHGHELLGSRLAGVGEPELEGAPEGALGRGHGPRRVAGDALAEDLRF